MGCSRNSGWNGDRFFCNRYENYWLLALQYSKHPANHAIAPANILRQVYPGECVFDNTLDSAAVSRPIFFPPFLSQFLQSI